MKLKLRFYFVLFIASRSLALQVVSIFKVSSNPRVKKKKVSPHHQIAICKFIHSLYTKCDFFFFQTLVELKVEEHQLLKEKKNLKNVFIHYISLLSITTLVNSIHHLQILIQELANLRQRVEKERIKNEIFKRNKVGINLVDEKTDVSLFF